MNAHTRDPFHIRILKGLLGIIWSIDWPLMVIVLFLSAWGFVALYSAGYSFPWRIDGQIRNLAAAGAAMMLFATMPLKWTRNLAVPAYIVGLVLLVATLLFGVNTKGATRWLDIGVIRIQPSEIMTVTYPHLRAHETVLDLVCRLLLEKKKILKLQRLHGCAMRLRLLRSRTTNTASRDWGGTARW